MKYFFLMLSCLILALACSTPEEKELEKPNIIYIMADDLGIGDLGIYGQEQIQTPNLDRLAARGMTLTNHYSGSTVCAPSRCTLMTGKHTGNATIRSNQANAITDEDITVGEILKEAGYQTAIIGKWGLGDQTSEGSPKKQGFDYFYGFLNQIKAHNSFPDSIWENNTRLHLDNEVEIAQSTYAKGIGSSTIKRGDYIHDLFLEKCLSFIDQNKKKPFYLYYAATIPHANNEYWINQEHGIEAKNKGIYEKEDWPETAKAYAAMVTDLDRQVGEIWKKIEKEGLAENTIIIFTSDNGVHAEGLNDPEFHNSNSMYRGIKRDLYEGGIKTPHIAVWKNHIQENSQSDLLSAFWDFLPTAADLAGVRLSHKIDGISYLPTLLGKEQKNVHQILYWEFYEQGGKQAIRQGDWKGIRLNLKNAKVPSMELYNLKDDPSESNDLAKLHPDKIHELEKAMNDARSKWSFDQFLFEE